MVQKAHNPEKDIRKLANAILRCAEMPPEKKGGPCMVDITDLVEKAIPLARRMKNRYKSKRKPVGGARPK